MKKVEEKCVAGKGKEAIGIMKGLEGKLAGIMKVHNDPQIVALYSDVNFKDGRLAKAFSTPERFQRWGAHYMRACIRSHQLQIQTNKVDKVISLLLKSRIYIISCLQFYFDFVLLLYLGAANIRGFFVQPAQGTRRRDI